MADEIPDEVRVSIDGLDGPDQGAFAELVDATHPDQQSLQIDGEDSGRTNRV